jgi:hypothetical protein
MAITILDTPATYSSMHDDLWFVSSSTNSGTNNFKFVYDVLINGSIVARNKVFPSPSGDYGVFNASPIVRAFVTNYFEPSGNSILVASNNKLKVDYTIQIGEEVSGVVTTNLVSGNYSAYNFYPPLFADMIAVKNDIPLVLSSYYDNLLIQNFTDDWLTERDTDAIEIEFGDNFYASYFRRTLGNYNANLEIVGSNGLVLQTITQPISFTGEFNLFNLQSGHLNEWAGSEVINENTFAYNFYLTRGTATSKKLKFKQKCYPKYRQYNLHFINRLGGWDTMKFSLVNRRSSEFERSTYRRNDWQLNGSQMSNVDSYNRYNETALNYSIQHKDKFNLKSDYINEQDYSWLGQLVASSVCYIEVLGAYFPVIISSSNFEYRVQNADKIFNFEIDIEVSKYINSQFR